eukprot:95143_1
MTREQKDDIGMRLSAPLNLALSATPGPERLKKYHDEEEEDGVSLFTGCCYAINIIMGSGFLVIPSGMAALGVGGGIVVLLFAAIVVGITVGYEVEAMARTERWMREKFLTESITSSNIRPTDDSSKYEMTPLQPSSSPSPIRARRRKEREPLFELSNQEYQITEMLEVYATSGKDSGTGRLMLLKWIYDVLLGMYLFFTLWGYVAVFSAALCEHYPVGSSEFLSKLVYTTIFGIIAIPLCLLGVKEQAAFQVFMTGVRLLVIAIMSGTAFWAYYSGVDSFSGMTLNPTPAPRFRSVSLAVMLPVSFFSLMLNSYTPTVVQGLKNKGGIRYIGWIAPILSALLYIVISVSLVAAFGVKIPDSCNTLWEFYTGRPESEGSAFPWATILRFVIVLFPALDVISVYPVNTIVAANVLMALVYHDRVDKAMRDRVVNTTFRLACGIPPILLSFLCSRLKLIETYAGSISIVIALIFPSYLSLQSRKRCQDQFGTSQTAYDTLFSSPTIAKVILFVGISLFILSIVTVTYKVSTL